MSYHQILFCNYILCEEEPRFNGCCRDDGYFISFNVVDASPACDTVVMRVDMSERMSWHDPCVTTRMWAVVADGVLSAWMTADELEQGVSRLQDDSDADAWIDAAWIDD